jgi:hypothetical protein
MHFQRWWIALFLTLVCTLPVADGAAFAGNKKKFDELRQAYLQVAFPFGVSRLRKFASVDPLTFVLVCPSQLNKGCNATPRLLEDVLFEGPSFRLRQQDKKSQLQINFENSKLLEFQYKKIKELFPVELATGGGLKCQVHMILDNGEIKSSLIVVSLDEPPKKAKSCLLFTFFKSLGLGHFSELNLKTMWDVFDGVGEGVTEDQFLIVKKQFEIFIYIHSCALLRPNMTRIEVEKILENENVCTRDLGVE